VTEVRGQMTEGRGRKTEGRRKKTEDGGQITEEKGFRFQCCGRPPAASLIEKETLKKRIPNIES